MTHSVCINYGKVKNSSIGKCHNCHFKPISDEAKAKSLILSLAYEINGEYRGKTKEELNKIAVDIVAVKWTPLSRQI
jgi:hypothetical protein